MSSSSDSDVDESILDMPSVTRRRTAGTAAAAGSKRRKCTSDDATMEFLMRFSRERRERRARETPERRAWFERMLRQEQEEKARSAAALEMISRVSSSASAAAAALVPASTRVASASPQPQRELGVVQQARAVLELVMFRALTHELAAAPHEHPREDPVTAAHVVYLHSARTKETALAWARDFGLTSAGVELVFGDRTDDDRAAHAAERVGLIRDARSRVRGALARGGRRERWSSWLPVELPAFVETAMMLDELELHAEDMTDSAELDGFTGGDNDSSSDEEEDDHLREKRRSKWTFHRCVRLQRFIRDFPALRDEVRRELQISSIRSVDPWIMPSLTLEEVERADFSVGSPWRTYFDPYSIGDGDISRYLTTKDVRQTLTLIRLLKKKLVEEAPGMMEWAACHGNSVLPGLDEVARDQHVLGNITDVVEAVRAGRVAANRSILAAKLKLPA